MREGLDPGEWIGIIRGDVGLQVELVGEKTAGRNPIVLVGGVRTTSLV